MSQHEVIRSSGASDSIREGQWGGRGEDVPTRAGDTDREGKLENRWSCVWAALKLGRGSGGSSHQSPRPGDRLHAGPVPRAASGWTLLRPLQQSSHMWALRATAKCSLSSRGYGLNQGIDSTTSPLKALRENPFLPPAASSGSRSCLIQALPPLPHGCLLCVSLCLLLFCPKDTVTGLKAWPKPEVISRSLTQSINIAAPQREYYTPALHTYFTQFSQPPCEVEHY